MTNRTSQGGFAYIAAVVLLVVMASLAAAMARLNSVQLTTANQDLQAARATLAARAGVEWGLAQLRTDNCQAEWPTLTDFRNASGFVVTVRCARTQFDEGETAAGTPARNRLYEISATACNVGTVCPNNAQVTHRDYVERRRVATACIPGAVGQPVDPNANC